MADTARAGGENMRGRRRRRRRRRRNLDGGNNGPCGDQRDGLEDRRAQGIVGKCASAAVQLLLLLARERPHVRVVERRGIDSQ